MTKSPPSPSAFWPNPVPTRRILSCASSVHGACSSPWRPHAEPLPDPACDLLLWLARVALWPDEGPLSFVALRARGLPSRAVRSASRTRIGGHVAPATRSLMWINHRSDGQPAAPAGREDCPSPVTRPCAEVITMHICANFGTFGGGSHDRQGPAQGIRNPAPRGGVGQGDGLVFGGLRRTGQGARRRIEGAGR